MFTNREQAGEVLAGLLADVPLERPVVFALPRGGVPVALAVARALGAPLDLLLVRKLGLPAQPELAAGALVDGPPEHVVFNDDILRAMGLTRDDLEPVIARERARNAERREIWLKGRAPLDLTGRSAVVVDDGIATGATMRAALAGLRARRPQEIVLAVPVAARDALREMEGLADRVIVAEVPQVFQAVGLHYREFGQVDDAEVTAMMAGLQEE